MSTSITKAAGAVLAGAAAALGAKAFALPAAKIRRMEALPPEGPSSAYYGRLPDADSIFGYAADLVDMGARLPGTEAGAKAQAYVKDKFEEFGLENVSIIPAKTKLYKCEACSLNIGDEEIAALQLIAYTEYKESTLDVLKRAHHLIERMKLSDKDKLAIIYILNVLSANMLSEKDKKEYLEETTMMLNPRDEYMKNKGKEEIAKSLKGTLPIEEIAKHTGLTIEKIKSL